MTRSRPTQSRRTGLAFRISVLAAAVAALSVLVAAAVSYGLVRDAAQDQARQQLSRQASLVAGLNLEQTRAPRFRGLLRDSGIRLVVLPHGKRQRGPVKLPASDVDVLESGRPLSTVEIIGGKKCYVEGRQGDAGAIALVQVADEAPGSGWDFYLPMLIALAAGLLVAVVAGVLLARRLVRPLAATAAAAHRLATGDRRVRITRDGPSEVAEVAAAVNGLTGALEVSEARQRDFLLSISHELRTPLTSIAGFAEALADGVTEPADVPAAGRTIQTESARLERLIADLLELARVRAQDFPIHFDRTDLRQVVADAGTVWAARAKAREVAFRVDLPDSELDSQPGKKPDDEIVAELDSTRLRQVIDCLLDNALRITPAGEPVILALARDQGGVRIDVRDGGPGLTAADYSVAFEATALHQRYRARRGGLGIGLALVHRLTARMGGTATAGPAPEGGARFTLWFPLNEHPA